MSVCVSPGRRSELILDEEDRKVGENFVKDYYEHRHERTRSARVLSCGQSVNNAYFIKRQDEQRHRARLEAYSNLQKKCSQHYRETMRKKEACLTQSKRNEEVLLMQAKQILQYINVISSSIARGAIG